MRRPFCLPFFFGALALAGCSVASAENGASAAADAHPGDIKGDGVGGVWHLARP